MTVHRAVRLVACLTVAVFDGGVDDGATRPLLDLRVATTAEIQRRRAQLRRVLGGVGIMTLQALAAGRGQMGRLERQIAGDIPVTAQTDVARIVHEERRVLRRMGIVTVGADSVGERLVYVTARELRLDVAVALEADGGLVHFHRAGLHAHEE
jgi:hypothetical protein